MRAATEPRRVPTPCLGCGAPLVLNKFFCSNACMLRTPATEAVGLAILTRASRMLPPPRRDYLELVR